MNSGVGSILDWFSHEHLFGYWSLLIILLMDENCELLFDWMDYEADIPIRFLERT